MSSLPRNQVGSGGIEKVASSRQHRDDRRDVGAVPGVDEAGDELARALVAQRPQRLLLRTGRALALELRAGPLQGAVDRRDRGLEHLGGLPGAEAEHVAQEQHRALVGRQELERGDVGELDALALLVAQELVGIGLDPDRLGQRLGERRARIVPAPVPPGSSRRLRPSSTRSEALVAIV